MAKIEKKSIGNVMSDVIHLYDISSEMKFDSIGAMTTSIECVFICGNPGPLEFYTDFLYDFWMAMKSIKYPSYQVNMHAIGNANHHTEPNYQERAYAKDYKIFDLQRQIDHKVSFIYDIISKSSSKQQKLIFICHSIGSYIALAVMQQDLVIKNMVIEIILIMPFLLWKNIPFYHKFALNVFARGLPFTGILLKAIGFRWITSPSFLRTSLTKLVTGLSGSMLSIVAHDLLSMRMIDNFIVMGRDEIIGLPRDEEIMLHYLIDLDKVGMPICVLYTGYDVWAPSEDIKVLKKAFVTNRENIFYIHGLSHAFTLNPKSIDKMLNKIASYFSSRKSKLFCWNPSLSGK